jgi:type I restriction enzyme R subunit
MAREVFKKFKACINIKSASKYREQADITDIIRQLHEVVDAAIDIKQFLTADPDHNLYDISKIDFDRLRKEFERCRNKNTTVANLKDSIEKRLDRMIQQNPLRTDFQEHYEKIVSE